MADAQREAFAEALDSTLANKSDVREVRTDVISVKSDVARVEAKLEAKMDKVMWMLGILIALASAGFSKQFF